MPRKKAAVRKHTALHAVTSKTNPLIFNEHNPNHVHGKVKGKFLHNPFGRVFNVDESVQEATPAVVVPSAPTRRRAREFTADQENSPMIYDMFESPTRAPSPIPVDKRPLDLFSREIQTSALPSVAVNQVTNNLVGHMATGAIALPQRQSVVATSGHLPDNTFPVSFSSDIPMLTSTVHAPPIIAPRLPVEGVSIKQEVKRTPPATVLGKRTGSLAKEPSAKNMKLTHTRTIPASVLGKRAATGAVNKRVKLVHKIKISPVTGKRANGGSLVEPVSKRVKVAHVGNEIPRITGKRKAEDALGGHITKKRAIRGGVTRPAASTRPLRTPLPSRAGKRKNVAQADTKVIKRRIIG